MSMCRQIPGCENNVSEAITGTRGTGDQPTTRSPANARWNFARNRDNDPYQEEHVALIESIRNNRPINDLRNVTISSLTAVMGRMACYTGRAITWEDALNSNVNLMPQNLAWNMELPVPPVAMPGRRQ